MLRRPRIRPLTTFPIAVALLMAGSVSGCGESDYPDMARVTGVVTYKGKPVTNMMVNFMPCEGRPSWGKTDDEGRYELIYDEDYKGAKVDHHRVYLTAPASTVDGGASKASRRSIAKTLGLTSEELADIRTRYGTEEKTRLAVDVKKDPEVLNLRLE